MTPEEVREARWRRWSEASDRISEYEPKSRVIRGIVNFWWTGTTVWILLSEWFGLGLRQLYRSAGWLAENGLTGLGIAGAAWPLWVLLYLIL